MTLVWYHWKSRGIIMMNTRNFLNRLYHSLLMLLSRGVWWFIRLTLTPDYRNFYWPFVARKKNYFYFFRHLFSLQSAVSSCNGVRVKQKISIRQPWLSINPFNCTHLNKLTSIFFSFYAYSIKRTVPSPNLDDFLSDVAELFINRPVEIYSFE